MSVAQSVPKGGQRQTPAYTLDSRQHALQFSNFNGNGPERVGRRPGIGAFGTYDMAGNVKEWCWNAAGNRRYILGGGWNESRSYYIASDALSPFDRSPANGFRCMRCPGGTLSDELIRPVERPALDYRTEKPVSDSAFRILQSVHSYDRTELKAVTESADERSPYWRAERITFDDAYDHQRVIGESKAAISNHHFLSVGPLSLSGKHRRKGTPSYGLPDQEWQSCFVSRLSGNV